MRIKLKQPVLNYENKPLTAQNSSETMNFFDVFINALNGQLPNDILTAEVKNRIYQISKKIYKSDEPNFTTEELSLIKERVGKIYAPMIYGRVCDLIDGTGEPTEPKEEKPSVS